MKRIAKKVLLVGWDAADWKFLSPLMDEGLMPNLQLLVEGGVKGRLATLDPPLSPTLWTSIATGKRPYKHGIHGFAEPNPGNKGIRPINSTSRNVKAVWNILSQCGLRSNVIGWWPSHPAEPINGVMVSNFYQKARAGLAHEWPLPKGTVHPVDMTDTLAKLRVHPGELTAAHIQPFVPDAWKVDQNIDRRLDSIARITADCSSIHSATTYLMQHTDWDLTAVYFDAIDHYCHAFMKYHPPYRPHIDRSDYELYKGVVQGGCRYHDMMLGRLMQLAGEDTTIILISDHGFHPDHHRPKTIPKEPAGPAVEHSPFGIIVVNGPGIKRDELLFGAGLLDITPTLLTLFGLPIADDMDGKVLTQAFEELPAIETIPSWENIPGAAGSHSTLIAEQPEAVESELRQLIELGYIADPGDNLELAAKRTRDENNFYLARAYFDGGEWEEGIRLLEQLHISHPGVIRYAVYLTHVYQTTGKFKMARKMVDHIRENVDRESPQLDVLEGTLLLAEQRYRKALLLFQKAEQDAENIPQLYIRIAHAYLQLNKLEPAEQLLRKSIENDPEDVNAYHLLGICCFRRMHYGAAMGAFMEAIGLWYYFPAAHFYLGETLLAMERYDAAAAAFDVCLRLAPGMNRARQRIITIYQQYLEQPGKALKYQTDLENNLKGEIIVVSGLPRSGTSMMMQMLQAGGMDVFSDYERSADENNPKGYFEHEAVKNLANHKAWLSAATGKVVKVIAQQLHHLPMNYRYRIIFMERDLVEIVRSQQQMLARNGKKVKENTLPLSLISAYEQRLKKVESWAEAHDNVEVCHIQYAEVVAQPFLPASQINDFLGGFLQIEKMAQEVDSNLYREKTLPSINAARNIT